MTQEELKNGLNNINRVMREYFNEDDRAAATLVAAELDVFLLKLLSVVLLPAVKDASAPLLGRGEPLEAFGARIELAYRIGLIPPIFHHDLHLIRKIRNEFAHGRAGLTFEEGRVAKLAGKLVTGRHEIESTQSKKKDLDVTKALGGRNLFRMASALLLSRVFLLTAQAKPVSPQWPQFFRKM